MSEEEKKDSTAPDLATKTAAARPLVTVYSLTGKATKKTMPMPDIMLSPIRHELVSFIHSCLSRNTRQPYGVMHHEGPKGARAGHQVAAKSWGTGRAVSRIPRVKGGGTHRAGQGAYGNMCRGGHMFAPTKTFRKWTRRTNPNQQEYAICSAIAASAVPALVMARGHRIHSVNEVPIVIEGDFQRLRKTRAVFHSLKHLRLTPDLKRCKKRTKRAGRGKMRNRRWKRRTGPLIIYHKDFGIAKAARNIPGVDVCQVEEMSLLKLAPGGHVGRLIVWTEHAFAALNEIYGTIHSSGTKSGYHLPRPMMKNSDLKRILQSQEIQSVLRAKRPRKEFEKKRNPLVRPEIMCKLNPAFEEEWNGIKDEYDGKQPPKTLQIIKPMWKKQKIQMHITKEEQDKMGAYWKNVLGDDMIFKSRELLAAEREAVAKAVADAEREKAGLDLLELLGGGGDDGGDDDSESS